MDEKDFRNVEGMYERVLSAAHTHWQMLVRCICQTISMIT